VCRTIEWDRKAAGRGKKGKWKNPAKGGKKATEKGYGGLGKKKNHGTY